MDYTVSTFGDAFQDSSPALKLHREVSSRPSNRALCFLSDARTRLSQCNIPKEPLVSRCSLDTLWRMRIFITTATGPTILLDVKPSDTIYSVKDIVRRKEHIPPSRQSLVLAHQVLEDVKTLAYYNIQHGTVLELHERRRGMYIYVVTPPNKTITLEVTPRHTIGDVKRMIEDRTGIPLHTYRLLFHCSKLWDDHLTLEDYQVETGTTLCCFFSLLSSTKCPGTRWKRVAIIYVSMLKLARLTLIEFNIYSEWFVVIETCAYHSTTWSVLLLLIAGVLKVLAGII